jgi:hypothetical protein
MVGPSKESLKTTSARSPKLLGLGDLYAKLEEPSGFLGLQS